jgi:thiol-disulfide isomerase/thioredoxin
VHDTNENVLKIAVGEAVPEFEVTINGKPCKLSELQANTLMTQDGTLVLTFWCSFCHSCRHVEHRLDALARQYKGKVGVIALDASAGETTEGVAEFAKEQELTLPIALDATGATADILGTRVTTTTVVIDKSGVLRYRGRFADEQHAYAEEALRAVLTDADVPAQETPQKG